MGSRSGVARFAASQATPVLLAAALLLPVAARASGPELFGLGAEAAGVAGAMAARAQGASAGYYDPAALADGPRYQVGVGLLGFRSRLTIERDGAPPVTQPIRDPLAVVVLASARVPLRGWLHDRLSVGVAIHLVPEELLRVVAHRPDEPSFPCYDNRTQRLVLLPQAALRLGAGFSLGVAVNFLAGLKGYVEASPGASRAIEPLVDERVVSTAALHLGLRWRSAGDRLALALVFRDRFRVPIDTTTRAFVAGQPLAISVAAEGLYTPPQLVLGGALRATRRLLLSADVTAAFWSGWGGPWVTVESELPLVGALAAPPPALAFRDTLALRLGAEAELPLDARVALLLRAGYGIERSPLPAEQQAPSQLLDGRKHIVAAGVGLRFALGPALPALRLDAHGQLHVVESMSLERPGTPALRGGGTVLSAGLLLSVSP